MATTEDELFELDRKIKQLKLDYEQYFLGTRPREPAVLRSDVQKQIVQFSNTPIQNTAQRFRFNSINSRYQAYKRQWDDTLRKIEAGTYQRHRFKADLHARQRLESDPATPAAGGSPATAAPAEGSGLFEEYRSARESCGQANDGLTPARLQKVIEEQRAQLRQRFGEAEFRFRVVVEDGRAKLKATPVRKSA